MGRLVWWGHSLFLGLLTLSITAGSPLHGQEVSDDQVIYAANVGLTQKAPQTYLVTWEAYRVDPCEWRVAYDVHRDMKEDFTPSSRTLIGSTTGTSLVSHEPKGLKDSYYLVTVQLVPSSCSLHSGAVGISPLDLGAKYQIAAGSVRETCDAISTTELRCPSLALLHAIVAEQSGHEFLLGCADADYESGAWNCANLSTGWYRILVHSMTATVIDSGLVKANETTGKELSKIVPVFSILAKLR